VVTTLSMVLMPRGSGNSEALPGLPEALCVRDICREAAVPRNWTPVVCRCHLASGNNPEETRYSIAPPDMEVLCGSRETRFVNSDVHS